jgi:tripartite-type tricarboxylate transporter receptor subunit TctC
MKRLAILALGLAAALLPFTASAADPYPAKAIRLVVIYTAGGANDIVARAVGEKLSQAMGQPVIIENKPGAAGYIGADYVAKSQPDGYTLLVGGNPQIVGPLLYKAHKLNAIKDFTAVANLVRAPIVMVSAPSLPANNAKELFQMAKAKPGQLSYASTSPSFMMSLEQINSLAGIDLLRVAYKGMPEALVDVTAGRVSVMLDTIGAQLPHIKAGRTKALAVTGSKRYWQLPDVPTIAESGLVGYDEDPYIGLLGPAGMDPAVVERINTEVGKILKDPDLKAKLENMGFTPEPTSTKVFAEMLVTTQTRYARVVERIGLKPE